jgi:hypothetical protein
VLWFNMREEPVVYINGLPFVLREHRRPLKNLQVRRVAVEGRMAVGGAAGVQPSPAHSHTTEWPLTSCLSHPVALSQEYAGIESDRLERMEARLKADVLAEAGV